MHWVGPDPQGEGVISLGGGAFPCDVAFLVTCLSLLRQLSRRKESERDLLPRERDYEPGVT